MLTPLLHTLFEKGFIAFTGCSTVSSMYNCSKTRFWDELVNSRIFFNCWRYLLSSRISLWQSLLSTLIFWRHFLVKVYYSKKEFINWWESSSFQTTSFCQHQAASPFTTWIDWAYQASIYPRWLVVGRMHSKGAKTKCYWMELAAWKWGWICPTMVNSWWNFHNWQCHTNMQLKKDNMQIVQMRQIRTCLSAILQMWEIFWKLICNPSL